MVITDSTLCYATTCLVSFTSNYVSQCPTCHRWVVTMERREWCKPLECESCLKVRYG